MHFIIARHSIFPQFCSDGGNAL